MIKDFEVQVKELFTEVYGVDFRERAGKLKEECLELVETIDNLSVCPKDGELDMFIDELSDTLAVLTHVTALLNMTNDELLLIALKKTKNRIKSPDFVIKKGKI